MSISKKWLILPLCLAIIFISSWFVFGGHFFPAAVGASSLVLGDLVKLADDPAVYLVGQDGKRYVFPNESIYYSWYSAVDFNNVKTISPGEMASLSIGGNVSIRPGTKLVKITTDPKVYAVTKSGLRWVSSEAIAIELYGSNWAKRVVDVPDTLWADYSVVSPIVIAVYPEGTLFKQPSSNALYLMGEDGKAKAFNNDAFTRNGFKEDDVVETMKSYESSGSGVSSFDNSLRYPDKVLSSTPNQNQCSTGETKEYTCTDGTRVFWCSCENSQWSCIISPEIQCPAKTNCTDQDGDGYGATDSTGCVKSGVDCNDNISVINPSASEVCGDSMDNNCNDQVDDGCQQQSCTNGQTQQCGPSTDTGVCQYGGQTCSGGQWGSCAGAVYPTTEVCTNNLDDDCDGSTDESCTCSDNTNYGQCSTTKPKFCENGSLVNKCATCGCLSGQQCQSNGSCLTCTDSDSDGYYSQGGNCGTTDCNDSNASIHPGAAELCANNSDDDCDGQIDENCSEDKKSCTDLISSQIKLPSTSHRVYDMKVFNNRLFAASMALPLESMDGKLYEITTSPEVQATQVYDFKVNGGSGTINMFNYNNQKLYMPDIEEESSGGNPNLYDYDGDVFTKIRPNTSAQIHNWAFIECGGYFWQSSAIYTYSDLWSIPVETFLSNPDAAMTHRSVSSSSLYTMLACYKGNLYMGDAHLVDKFNISNNLKSNIYYDATNTAGMIETMIVYDDKLWFGGKEGIYVYDGQSVKKIATLGVRVWDFVLSPNGGFYVVYSDKAPYNNNSRYNGDNLQNAGLGYVDKDGSFNEDCQFSEESAYSVAVFNGKLVTGHNGGVINVFNDLP